MVESVSCESDEIRLSLSHKRERETMRYSQMNNKKNHMPNNVKTQPLDRIDIVALQIESKVINFRYRIFNVFSYIVCHFFDFWCIIKYFLTVHDGNSKSETVLIFPRNALDILCKKYECTAEILNENLINYHQDSFRDI